MDVINLSVIVPVYNPKRNYFMECIRSILKQDRKDMEVLLVDDGSRPACRELCDFFSRHYSGVRVIHQAHRGVSHARNTGIRCARGQWIAFVDADDWLEQNALNQLYENGMEYGVDLVFARNYYDRRGHRFPNHFQGQEKLLSPREKEELIQALFCGRSKRYSSAAMPWAKLYRTDFLRDNKIVFEPGLRIGEDGLFNLQVLLKSDNVTVLNKLVYVYRQQEQSASNSYHPSIPDNCRILFQKYRKVLLENGRYDRYIKYFSLFMVRYWELYLIDQYLTAVNSKIPLKRRIKKLKRLSEKKICQKTDLTLCSFRQRRMAKCMKEGNFVVLYAAGHGRRLARRVREAIKGRISWRKIK